MDFSVQHRKNRVCQDGGTTTSAFQAGSRSPAPAGHAQHVTEQALAVGLPPRPCRYGDRAGEIGVVLHGVAVQPHTGERRALVDQRGPANADKPPFALRHHQRLHLTAEHPGQQQFLRVTRSIPTRMMESNGIHTPKAMRRAG